MNLATRLGRLAPVLTAKERAAIVLRAQNAGTEPDPEILRTLPDDQRREFNHYVGLAYVANNHLGVYGQVLSLLANAVENHAEWVFLFERAAGVVADEMGTEVDTNKVRGWHTKKSVTLPEWLMGLADDLRQEVISELALHWKDLRALQTVWDEINAEFDGEDMVTPSLRTQAGETAERLKEVAAELRRGRTLKLPEPNTEVVDSFRKLVEDAMRALGVIQR